MWKQYLIILRWFWRAMKKTSLVPSAVTDAPSVDGRERHLTITTRWNCEEDSFEVNMEVVTSNSLALFVD